MTRAKDYQSFLDQYKNRPHYFKLAKEIFGQDVDETYVETDT